MENKNKFIIIIISIVLFLLIGVGGVFAFLKFGQEVNIAKKIVENIINIKTFSYSGLIKATLNNPDPIYADVNGDMDVVISGDMDVNDENIPRGNMSMSFKSNTKLNNSIPSLSYDMVYNSKDTSYLKIKDISFSALDLTSIKNKWIKVDVKALGSLLVGSDIDPASLDIKINKEQEKQIQDLMLKSNILKFVGKKSNQKIGDLKMDNYEFSIDEESLIGFMISTDKILNGDKSTMTVVDLKEMFGEVEFENLNIWINKSDLLPYKLSIKIKTKGGYVDLDMNFNNFNKPVIVQVPTEFKTLEEIMTEVLMSSYETAPVQ